MRENQLHRRILVVDDKWDARVPLTEGLKDYNFEVISAENGIDALEKIKSFVPNVVVTDIKMPGMDGADFTKIIKEMDPHIPVVTMTAYTNDPLVDKALKAGAERRVLPKPFEIEELLALIEIQTIRDLLRKHGLDSKSTPYLNECVDSLKTSFVKGFKVMPSMVAD